MKEIGGDNMEKNSKSTETKEILCLNEAAKFMGVSTPWLRQRIKEGIIPGIRIGHRWFLSRYALLALTETKVE